MILSGLYGEVDSFLRLVLVQNYPVLVNEKMLKCLKTWKKLTLDVTYARYRLKLKLIIVTCPEKFDDPVGLFPVATEPPPQISILGFYCF